MNKLLVRINLVTPGRSIVTSASHCKQQVPADSKKDANDIRNIVPTISSNKSFPSIEALELKRGTGGRSSFSGIVATVFGPGDVGRAVINGLARTGAQVIVPYRDDPMKIREIKLHGDLGQILFVPIHLRDDVSLRKAMKYSSVVVNCIGAYKETPNFTFDEVHVEGCARIARIAREMGINRLIHVSHLNASPDPPATYIRGGSKFLRSKYAGEIAVRNEFPEVTIFRPSDAFGSVGNWAMYWAYMWRRHLKCIYLPKGGKGIYKMPVAVKDIGEGIVNAISDSTTMGRVIEAYGPAKHELYDIVRWQNDVLQMNPWWGFKGIRDLKTRPGYLLRVRVLEKFSFPPVSLDRLELETLNETPNPANLNLYHLGVEPASLEQRGRHILQAFNKFGAVPTMVNEVPKPDPIPVYPAFYPNED